MSEGEYISQFFDGDEEYSESYSVSERKDYVFAKSRAFRPEDVGKYVVMVNSRYKRRTCPNMYLVNREITKRMWWSPSAFYAMIFDKKEAAEYQAKRYKYNKPRVFQIKKDWARRKEFIEEYGEE